ncbi:MAG TPA: D-xylose ABC transporter ATP-binding protein [Firmicutes bacterium]|jgi:ABC-type sugar transport system ATPase subunit|nr:D-xylose ABC transporter ATP-binding protein [Bacillota bacterium]
MVNDILRVVDIDKSFDENNVLKKINFSVERGEIHALIGENGAGKTTLMRIIGGIIPVDNGELYLNGEKVVFHNPIQAMHAGISIVHQELSLSPNLSVAQNIYLRREITNSFGFIKHNEMRNEAKKVFDKIGINIDPDRMVGQLSVGMRQIVEIAKAIALGPQIMIMDEPTSSLSENETRMLFELIRGLVKSGISIVYISHKISEIFDISDRISVLRDGHLIYTKKTSETNSNEVIQNMVGREITNLYPEKSSIVGETVLECKNLGRFGFFNNVSFILKKGEMLGFYGLVGSGRTEVAKALIGSDKLTSGEIFLTGKKVRFKTPRDAIKNGVCYLTEDRKVLGLFTTFSICKNLISANLDKFITKMGFLKNKVIKEESLALSEQMTIFSTNNELKVINLSGGNQQKVLLAKWICPNPKVLIVDEPTRGVDVGAKALIHNKLRELTNQGMAIIMITSELPECIGLSDRIAVFKDGQITAVLENSKVELKQNEVIRHAIK